MPLKIHLENDTWLGQKQPASKLSGALWRRCGKRKERWLLRLWNLTICIEKVDVKCRFAEMTLVMTSLRLVCVFCVLFTFALISALYWLAQIWLLSWWGATGELEVEFKFQTRSCKLSVLYPPCRPPESPQARLKTTFQFFTLVWQIWLFLAFLAGVKVKRPDLGESHLMYFPCSIFCPVPHPTPFLGG